ncbi:MAG: U32 family peptidase [Kordiimonadaceae bacterium]|jgi:O2-independent ubiquinone biosynthesis protein UbiU|nr:U32 family peptidase [Kordiimonadaceae bacterium]MBT6036274.1 U32 family peptidase [Kordiimonadaceae bacterium]MBT6329664.1 U32 family peptidase [Kordiimonadaceae bacterium]MBT7581926.1 U32 family peptidase [Kordiimonadaceae bacterium]
METLELVCPAGTPAALRVAVTAGADAVYVGFRDETNARNFPGLNFSPEELAEAIDFAHERGVKVYLAVNTYAKAGNNEPWIKAIDNADRLKVDAIILADIGLLDYAANKYPDLRLHLSVQASASNPTSINFYVREFGVRRVVLPRVLSVSEIKEINGQIDAGSEVFAFGGMCPMAEGRCSLSSYLTGQSPNMNGVCSPASHVTYEQLGTGLASKLAGLTINNFEEHEQVGYPTLCKGRFMANGKTGYLFEEPTSLNISTILPELIDAGVTAFKIEGRQRSKAYIGQVVKSFRLAVDKAKENEKIEINMDHLSEGGGNTTGAFKKSWM